MLLYQQQLRIHGGQALAEPLLEGGNAQGELPVHRGHFLRLLFAKPFIDAFAKLPAESAGMMSAEKFLEHG
jgi:hypothetical protein